MSTISSVSPRTLADVIPGGLVRNVALVLGGAGFVGLTAQLAVPLPFTPVPLTGQTFGVLVVSGEVDEESAEQLRLAIEQHSAAKAAGITVDLTGVTYLPSAGVAVLVRASQELESTGTPFETSAVAPKP